MIVNGKRVVVLTPIAYLGYVGMAFLGGLLFGLLIWGL